jgi:CPA1 family monovalent cation:H+ antiporter
MAEAEIWILIGLFLVTIPLVALARRVDLPYPIPLVLGGLVLGFVPGLPRIRLEPDLVLVIFLPPLVYWEAVTAPTDAMRANAARIGVLAIGLVFATTIAVAAVAHASIPSLAWPMAFVLGAIVAPTDELASIPVLERMRMPRHLIAIIEGESLLNDASALILYGAAVAAATTGVLNLGHSVWQSLLAGLGGIALGLALGRLAVEGWRRIRDTHLQGAISFTLPFLVYVSAQRLGLSGVLAVVFAGIHVNRSTPVVLTPASRLQLSGYWETIVFLANTMLFLLLGLQLHELARTVLAEYSWRLVLWYAGLVNVTVIATRVAWLILQEYAPVIGGASEHEDPDWKHGLIAAWSGLRGAVSLAAALAIPSTLASGAPLPHRDLLIFLTLTVVLTTLIGGGLTLPIAVRWLRVAGGGQEEERELRRALLAMSQAALQRLGQLEREGNIEANRATELRRRYEFLRQKLDGDADEGARIELEAERDLVAAERAALIRLRELGEIDNTVHRRLQRALDLEEERLSRRSDGIGP